MQAVSFGIAFTTAISGVLVVAGWFCFVDDSNVIEATKSVESTGEEIFESVQKAINLWAGRVCATDGAPNPPKCFWWFIDFTWDGNLGSWKFCWIQDFDWSGNANQWQLNCKVEWMGSILTQNLDGTLVPLHQLEPNQAEKTTLGVMMSPNDDGKAGYAFLLKKTKSWAETVRSGLLKKYNILPMVKTTIMKTIEYPMALTSFTEKQWKQIMSSVLLAKWTVWASTLKLILGIWRCSRMAIPFLWTTSLRLWYRKKN